MKGGAIFTQKLPLVGWAGKIWFNLSVFQLHLPSLHPRFTMVAPPLWSPTIILNTELTSAYEPQALGLCIFYLSGLRALAWKLGLPWKYEATYNHQQKAWQCYPSVLKPSVTRPPCQP